MSKQSNATIELIGRNKTPVKVCDVINGKPKVKQREKKIILSLYCNIPYFIKRSRDTIKRLLRKLSSSLFASPSNT